MYTQRAVLLYLYENRIQVPGRCDVDAKREELIERLAEDGEWGALATFIRITGPSPNPEPVAPKVTGVGAVFLLAMIVVLLLMMAMVVIKVIM